MLGVRRCDHGDLCDSLNWTVHGDLCDSLKWTVHGDLCDSLKWTVHGDLCDSLKWTVHGDLCDSLKWTVHGDLCDSLKWTVHGDLCDSLKWILGFWGLSLTTPSALPIICITNRARRFGSWNCLLPQVEMLLLNRLQHKGPFLVTGSFVRQLVLPGVIR